MYVKGLAHAWSITKASSARVMAKFYQSLDAGNTRMHRHLLNITPFIVKTHGDSREVKMWRKKCLHYIL